MNLYLLGNGNFPSVTESNGKIGINDITPSAKLEIVTTTEQLRLSYDATTYTSFTVNSSGTLTIAPTGVILDVTGHLRLSGNYAVIFGANGRIEPSANGVFALYNSAVSDFGRLQFGGTTAAFPSIKRNGTGLDIRLADDSGAGSLSVLNATLSGSMAVPLTITDPGTTGNQTINKMAGRVNIAAAGTTVTVTNSLVTTNSIILCTIATNDATATLKNCVPGTGSFVITLTAATTAETAISFLVIN